MANEIYTLTHDGLAGLISAQAATRLLDRALQAKGLGANTVTRRQMKSVLLGPVVRELEGILPKAGVERNLRRIYISLPRPTQAPSESAQPVATPEQDDVEVASAAPTPVFEASGAAVSEASAAETPDVMKTDAVVNADLRAKTVQANVSELALAAARVDALHRDTPIPSATTPVVAEAFAETSAKAIAWEDETDEKRWSATFEPVQVEPVKPNAEPAVASAPRQMLNVGSEAQLSDVVMTFAKLEHVRLVMGMRASGEVVLSRGSSEDIDAIARLGTLALKLLSRSGKIRSYYLAHAATQLFLFPLGDYVLSVTGTQDLNTGEVFSTLSMLEEDV